MKRVGGDDARVRAKRVKSCERRKARRLSESVRRAVRRLTLAKCNKAKIDSQKSAS